jgi:chitodextrinase
LNLFALYTLRLVVKGSALSLYFDHEESPLLSVTDSAIKTGEYAGIRGTASAARSIEFKYFSATVPREFNPSSADDFNRPNSTNLGANWNELLPNLEIFGNQLRNVDAGSKAAVWNQAIGADQEVAVDCYVTATGNSCGVMGRWSNADNFYRARLDVGAKNITLFKTVNGTTTQLGAAASRPIVYSTYYRIRLLIKGNTLQVFFANETSPAISATDGSLTAGNFAGLRAASSAAATTGFDNFSAAAAGGTPPVNQPPAARISAAPASGTAPLKVHFDGIASSDPDGTILSYLWNFGDGSSASGAVLDHTYTGAGSFTATLTVTDNDGATGAAQVVIKADRPASSILFEDQFNRTTGLGADWKIVSGAYSTDGNFAVSSGATSWAQLMKTLPGSDYAVESVLVVPAGSLYSGVVARGNPSAFSADLYSAQIATNGSVNLYRRNAGSWTLLRSGSAGIAANQAYTLKLKVTGANPVNLEVSLNGSLLFSYSDASASRILSGVPGIENYNSGVKYDRFTVTAP